MIPSRTAGSRFPPPWRRWRATTSRGSVRCSPPAPTTWVAGPSAASWPSRWPNSSRRLARPWPCSPSSTAMCPWLVPRRTSAPSWLPLARTWGCPGGTCRWSRSAWDSSPGGRCWPMCWSRPGMPPEALPSSSSTRPSASSTSSSATTRRCATTSPAPMPGPPCSSRPALPWTRGRPRGTWAGAPGSPGHSGSTTVPGDHYTLLRSPHVAVLAERLSQYLNTLDQQEAA